MVNFDSLTEFEDSTIFGLEKLPTTIVDDDFVVEILVTLSSDLNLVERRNYGILDLLSDVGGISGLLFSGVSLLLGMLNANFFDNFMVSKLYKLRDTHGEAVDKESTFV